MEACDEMIRRFGKSEIPAVLVWVAKALVNKGTVLRDLKRPQDALEAYDEVVRRFGKIETPALLERVATALVNKGAVLGELNRSQDALKAYDEVVRRFEKSETPALLERVAGRPCEQRSRPRRAEPAAGRAGSLRRGGPSFREERDPGPP